MQLLLDVSDFAEQDLQVILRELHDNDMAETIESLKTEAERGAKGDWLEKLRIQLQPENFPNFIKSVSDIYWQFREPPKIKMEVDGVQIEVNRKEDLSAAIEHAKSLAKK
ncbi:hypothetical protein [Candidatus Albibeggiatoa sp. nov. NOAA]|uniref:hypothetical protein n=1 Tax=Candidatus Albibeggiatoa sp. nov. NOAA TaxID=3162724 RepID=UPI0032F488B4|nr:hypothetical protein [Thiotrichaceae bacterium]